MGAGNNAPLTRTRPAEAVYLGDADGRVLLDSIGLVYRSASALPAPNTGGLPLAVIGAGATITDEAITSYLRAGGRVVFLPRRAATGSLGAVLRNNAGFTAAGVHLPDWPEAAGLSLSDLRRRAPSPAWLVERMPGGAETGAGGLLARQTVGKGTALWCQFDPVVLDADAKTYLRFTRWRQTRALAQTLANCGGRFVTDEAGLFAPRSDRYHPDYRTDFKMGDDPYRYYNW